MSSHTALTYMLVAQRTLAQILNIWVPLDTQRLIRLNIFKDVLPLRDSMTHVYVLLSQVVQLMCEVINRIPSGQQTSKVAIQMSQLFEESRPLSTLSFFAKAFQNDLIKTSYVRLYPFR